MIKVDLIAYTPDADAVVASAANLCYSNIGVEDIKSSLSEEKKAKLIKHLFSSGHLTPFEHVSFTFGIEGISRVCTHQLVRHRLASFCLSGDTIIPAFKKNKRHANKKWTIKQLYDYSIDSRKKQYLDMMRIRSVDENGIIVSNKIKNITYSGKQVVYKITTRCGRTIKATAKHRFMTNFGWKRLEELLIGDILICNGEALYKNVDWLKDQWIDKNKSQKEIANMLNISEMTVRTWCRKLGLKKPHSDYPNRVAGHGVVGMFSKKMLRKLRNDKLGEKNPMYGGNNISPNGGRFRAIKLYNISDEMCESCGTKAAYERHHLDGNTLNNKRDNILFLCPQCHKGMHNLINTLAVVKTPIVSIEEVGEEETYDIEMCEPYHNFVANGFVVHNSQQSQRYVKMESPSIIVPSTIQNNEDALNKFNAAVHTSHIIYNELVDMGIPAEDARFILPHGWETKIVVTMNSRELHHFFSLRMCHRAQWEIQELARQMLKLVKPCAPLIFAIAGPNCAVKGYCGEGKGCGDPYPYIGY